jgi:hypothetical protein
MVSLITKLFRSFSRTVKHSIFSRSLNCVFFLSSVYQMTRNLCHDCSLIVLLFSPSFTSICALFFLNFNSSFFFLDFFSSPSLCLCLCLCLFLAFSFQLRSSCVFNSIVSDRSDDTPEK